MIFGPCIPPVPNLLRLRTLLLGVGLLSMTASGQIWQFDVDASDSAAEETQAGCVRMSSGLIQGNSTNGTFSPTGTFNGVTVTATAAGGFRDRGTGYLLTNEPAAALLRDFIFTDGAGAAITINLAGLPPGAYDVRSFHFDNSNLGALTNNAFDIQVEDAAGLQTCRGLLWSTAGSNYRVQAGSNAPVLITVRENGAGHRARFNGLRIVRFAGFDVDASDAPAAETQSGLARLTSSGITGDAVSTAVQVTGSVGGIVLTAKASGGFRDRSATGTLAGQLLAPVLRDFIFSDGANATIDLTLSGLAAGTYQMRSFHWDNVDSGANTAFNLEIQDAAGLRVLTNQLWSLSGSSFAVTSDGSPLVMRVRENNSNNRARFNGLEIGGGEVLPSTLAPPAEPGDHVSGDLIMLNDNAGWCWYQDEKLIYDSTAGIVLASTAANYLGYGGQPRDTDIDAVGLRLSDGARTRVTMGRRDGQGDDHNMGAVWIRPDGRYLHICTGHNDATRNSYFRISNDPHDPSAWGTEQFFNWRSIGNPDTSGNITYNNLHFLAAEGPAGRLYNIGRESQRSPNLAYSDDFGQTWHYMGKLTLTRTASSYSNGYLKYADNGSNRIDFITTEHHPRDFNTSIYHGYIQGGKSFNAAGTVIDTNLFDEIAPAPEDFTPVFLSSPEDGVNDGNEYHRAWTTELERTANGGLAALFTTRYGTNVASNRPGDADHRLFYARFDGAVWHTTELGKMGGPLYFSEQDYTGLGAIHPDNPDLIYISTPFDPRNQAPLARHEIFRGVTADAGATWQWTQITFDSTVDNLRPAIAKWDAQHTVVCWMRGSYVTQRDFDQTLVCLVDRVEDAGGALELRPAWGSTELVTGHPLTATGPDPNNGAADSQWHWNNSYGSAGPVLSAGESGTEDAPALRTTLTGLEPGVYDMFVFFWSRPGEDWRIRAGFAETNLLVFRRSSSQQCEATDFSTAVNVFTNGQALYRAYVGRRELVGDAAVPIYVNDFDATALPGTQRTSFQGVGYRRVCFPLEQVRAVSASRNGSTVSTEVRGFRGYTYQLQYSESLSPAQWQDAGLPVQGSGNPSMIQLQHTNALAESYYRVKVSR